MINYVEPPEKELSKKEILRYAGCGDEKDVSELYHECIALAKEQITYKACYSAWDFSLNGNKVTLPFMETESELLSNYLKGCKKAIFFACTIGIDFDRLILKYSKISPSKALMLQAIGAERIESLADSLESQLKKRYAISKPRISPGYGDWNIECQKHILEALQANKLLGVSLTASMLMSPTKSVTAILAVNGDTKQ